MDIGRDMQCKSECTYTRLHNNVMVDFIDVGF